MISQNYALLMKNHTKFFLRSHMITFGDHKIKFYFESDLMQTMRITS